WERYDGPQCEASGNPSPERTGRPPRASAWGQTRQWFSAMEWSAGAGSQIREVRGELLRTGSAERSETAGPGGGPRRKLRAGRAAGKVASPRSFMEGHPGPGSEHRGG